MKENVQQLPIMEAFYTIQGEGYFTGNPAYFIRTGGCDVGCVWCDVKESWSDQWPKHSVEQLVSQALAAETCLVVITGGEPLMYDMQPLTSALRKEGLQTHVETSGAHPLTGEWDWLCFSPKKFMKPREAYYQAADELKVVIYHKSDFAWAEEHAEKVRPECLLYLQPEWEKSEKILPELIEYVKHNPRWRISLQTHKFMKIP